MVCPVCRQALDWSETGCRCEACAHTYAIESGIPILLPPDAQRSLHSAAAASENSGLRAVVAAHPWLGRAVRWLRPPLPYDRHGRWCGQKAFEYALLATGGSDPVVIDLGAGEGKDDQLAGLSQRTRDLLLRTDIYPGPKADFVADAHRIPMADGTVDGVLLQGVVEHVARPWDIAAEIVRILKPGGVVFCEAPFVQWYHEDPKDYYRFTEDGLKELFRGCDCVQSGVAIGPVGAVVGIARELLPILFDNAYVYWPLKWLMAWVSAPLVLLDLMYRRRPRAKTVALGVYLVARKPAFPSA
jgi:uncharacterized protein YbaR (Trm112 family)/SAM-dependent methyltransferase